MRMSALGSTSSSLSLSSFVRQVRSLHLAYARVHSLVSLLILEEMNEVSVSERWNRENHTNEENERDPCLAVRFCGRNTWN